MLGLNEIKSKVEPYNFRNMEPEKYEEVCRIPMEQLPNMIHDDLIKEVILCKEFPLK